MELQIYVLLLSVVGLAFVSFSQPGLPEYFRYDSQKIHELVESPTSPTGDEAFSSIAWLYRTLGLHDPTVAGVVTFMVFAVGVNAITSVIRIETITVPLVTFLTVTMALGAVYLGQYSKDVLPLVFTLALASRLRSHTLVLTFAMLAYGLFFREYWLIVAFAFLAMSAGIRRAPLMLTCSVTAGSLWILTNAYLYTRGFASISDVRALTAETRIADAATEIVHPNIAGGFVGEVFGACLVWLQLLVPVSLFQLGTAYHFLIGATITGIWIFTLRPLVNRSVEPHPFLLLLLGLTFVQAIFEPDYGSYLRHLTPLLPGILLLQEPRNSDRVEFENNERVH